MDRFTPTRVGKTHLFSMAHAAHADFTVAVSRTKDQATFFPIRVFGKLAETCVKVKTGVTGWVDGKLDLSE